MSLSDPENTEKQLQAKKFLQNFINNSLQKESSNSAQLSILDKSQQGQNFHWFMLIALIPSLPENRERRQLLLTLFLSRAYLYTLMQKNNTIFPNGLCWSVTASCIHLHYIQHLSTFQKVLFNHLSFSIFNLRFWKLRKRGRFRVWVSKKSPRRSMLDVLSLPPEACRSLTQSSVNHDSHVGGRPEAFSTEERL